MDTKSKKILIGVLAGVVALCMFFGIVGATFRAGMMMGGRNYGYSRAVPQAVPPAASQDDVLPAPQAPRQNNGRNVNPGYYDDGSRFNRGGGFGLFGFIGGIFRFFGTLLFIGLIIFAIRALFFKRGWGGPGRWGSWGSSNASGVPPFFEEWHKRAHAPQPEPAAPAAEAPAPDAPKPTEGEAKPEDKPQDPQAI